MVQPVATTISRPIGCTISTLCRRWWCRRWTGHRPRASARRGPTALSTILPHCSSFRPPTGTRTCNTGRTRRAGRRSDRFPGRRARLTSTTPPRHRTTSGRIRRRTARSAGTSGKPQTTLRPPRWPAAVTSWARRRPNGKRWPRTFERTRRR